MRRIGTSLLILGIFGTMLILLCMTGRSSALKPPAAPVFSKDSGFYDEAFLLELHADEGERIYFSLDGSDPAYYGVLYTEPILVYDRSMEPTVLRSYPGTHFEWEYETDTSIVDRCFTVKAIAKDDKNRISEAATGKYFIGKTGYEGMVLSITADPRDLIGDDGIIVRGKEYDEWVEAGEEGDGPQANFLKRGREWEIPCTIDLFDNRKHVSEEKGGLRVQGDSSRFYYLKRFSIYARQEYDGEDYFSTDFFGDGSKVHSVVTRTGRANALFPKLTEGRSSLGIRSVPVTVFLNGEYWYDAWLGEKYSSYYFNSHFGIARDNIISVKNGELDEGDAEDYGSYMRMTEYIDSHDLSRKDAYDHLCDIMDIQSYIDYCCINLYAVNVDGDDKTNAYLWRTRQVEPGHEYADTKWRYALYDMDALDWIVPEEYGVSSAAEVNTFTAVPPDGDMRPFEENELFAALKENPDFCKQFVNTFMDMIDSDFSKENARRVLQETGLELDYNDAFFIRRPEYMKTYIKEEFD